MPKRKLIEGEKTSVEIVRMDLVKEKLMRTKESLKEYINRLIREDMIFTKRKMRNLGILQLETQLRNYRLHF